MIHFKAKILKIVAFTTVVMLNYSVNAQDLETILDGELPQGKSYTEATFKGTRILNGHSVENRKKGTLDFLISHRFGRVNTGLYEVFGLDQSNIRIALEYALIDNLTIGGGRSSFDKIYDGFVKYKVLRQGEGGASPVSISVFGSASYKTLRDFDPSDPRTRSQKLAYVSQLLIARKFSPSFSFQITPTYIHFNSVRIQEDPHDVLALGFGTRIKLSKRVAVSGEYFQSFNPLQSIDAQNSLAFGVDIETGGHVFQLILSNAITMIEKSFIAENNGKFFKGDIHFGFNISRSFQVGKHGKKSRK